MKLVEAGGELTHWKRGNATVPALYFPCPVDPTHVHELAYGAVAGQDGEHGRVYPAVAASIETVTLREELVLPCLRGTITAGILDYTPTGR
jgi:hypothetical protein